MIGLDTNLLARYLVRDDEAQEARVIELLDRCRENGTRCLITTIALCELEWVLTTSYQASRQEVVEAVRAFLTQELFEVEHATMVEEALERYRRGKGDLSDHLLGGRSQALGATTTYTFDRALRGSPEFTLL